MSTSYKKREWSRSVGESTETVSGARQLEFWADAMLLRADKQGVIQEAKANMELGAAVLAVGSEVVAQLTQLVTVLQVMLDRGAVAGTDCQPKEDEHEWSRRG